jgi:quinol monooxygenase YgiN
MAIPVPNLDGFSLHVTIYIDADNVPKFFEAMNTVFDKVSQEPELLYFEIFQDPENAGTISWVENWAKSPETFFKVLICVIVEIKDIR